MKTFFPLAESHAQRLHPSNGTVGESPVGYQTGFHWSERHLQCLWFDSRYRPAFFPLPNNERLVVLDPGEWNLEAGPDFLNAVLCIEPGGRQLRGDIELHVHPSDWDAHGHQHDPAYDPVIAHVTWFAGPPAKELPEKVLCLSMAQPISARLDLSLDDIDLKAYPSIALPETPRPCEAFLKNAPDRAHALLAAAGQYRLQAKAMRLRERLNQSGDRHQIFYEELMAAFGYKHNQAPFRALTRQIPAATLKGVSAETAYARLLSAANLLPQPDIAPDVQGQQFIRRLWDLAWKHADEPLSDEISWRLGNIRPQNAPIRRLAAAAMLFSGLRDLLFDITQLHSRPAGEWFDRVIERFTEGCAWPFWHQRLSFTSLPDPTQTHLLLGGNRIAAIITNVVLPFAIAENTLPLGAVDFLPPEDLSSPMRLTALHLFGRDHNPLVFYANNGLLQQGLLQIHLDFCLNANPECADCRLCATLGC